MFWKWKLKVCSPSEWLWSLCINIFLTFCFPDNVSGPNIPEAGSKILDKLANLTGEVMTGVASATGGQDDAAEDVTPGGPCPFLEAELRRVQGEDMQRKDLGAVKEMPGVVCPSCSMWLKVGLKHDELI